MEVREVQAPPLDEVFAAIVEAFPKLSTVDQRIAIAVYRLLATGRAAGIQDIAGRTEIAPSQVEGTLRSWHGIHFNDSGAVVGYWGLTLARTRHRLRVDGRDLYTWCAWDTLFIPMLLGDEADVESECPVSGERISMRVGRDGLESVSHGGAVVSFVTPQQGKIEENVIRNFCHYVHFLASEAHGKRWRAEHPGTFLLSLAQAWELGRRKNAAQYREALQDSLTL